VEALAPNGYIVVEEGKLLTAQMRELQSN